MTLSKAARGSKKRKTERTEEILPDGLSLELLHKAYYLMCMSREMDALYEKEKEICSRYVHSTSRGHEAIQLATGLQLTAEDYVSPYYRDESMLLGIGLTPYELMLQLLAKKDDPFSGGRSYYAHPSLNRPGMPVIPHQSSATGMQAIPATGMAHGIAYLESQGLMSKKDPVVLCSLGDGSVTEGEVSEAFQMAVLKKLPIIYLIQDNDWGISATGKEMRTMNAYEFAAGFKGMKRMTVDGADFLASWEAVHEAIAHVRTRQGPVLLHATCPLLGHHTSGVRMEWYRTEEDIDLHRKSDPLPRLTKRLSGGIISSEELGSSQLRAKKAVAAAYRKALAADDPDPQTVDRFEFAPTQVEKEQGQRTPEGAEKVVMVDAALKATDELLKKHPEALLYGQDVGGTLGGVFREAATLAGKHGDDRIFNTPIQEAYIIGSTAGMSAVGALPIVEIQFADYLWPGINQLVEELSKSCYLSLGKFPVRSLIRVPTGAYGGGGPYHSGCIESALLTIRGIKVVFPSNAADMKGLFKAAFYDPNPVIMLEHKGLYWSKVRGTKQAKTAEPDEEYIIPLGKGRMHRLAEELPLRVVIITYGMGVYWAEEAAKAYPGQVSILDLRTLNPLDWPLITREVTAHSRAMIVTEEPVLNSFAESLAGRISSELFHVLDAPVRIVGSANLPAVPLNIALEKQMLAGATKVGETLNELLKY